MFSQVLNLIWYRQLKISQGRDMSENVWLQWKTHENGYNLGRKSISLLQKYGSIMVHKIRWSVLDFINKRCSDVKI